MGVAFLQRRWTQKPPVGAQINWGHPLVRNLIVAWVLNEGGGNVVSNLVNPRDFGIVTGMPWKIDKAGLGLSHSGTSGTDTVINQLVVNGDVMSVGLRFSLPSLPSADSFLGGFGVGGAYEKDLTINPANELNWYVQTRATDTVALEAGLVYDVLGTQNHAANRLALYKNGSLVATGTSTSYLNYSSPPIHLGGTVGAWFKVAMTAYYFYVWNRELTKEDALWLRGEPYAFLLPPSPRMRYFFPSVAAPPEEGAVYHGRGVGRGILRGVYR